MKRMSVIVALAAAFCADRVALAADGADILKATGVQGGIVVHLGCGHGEMTASLWGGEAYTVHGLAASDEDVEAARKCVASRGLYGKVSVERLHGARLPYADNLINLLVAEDLGAVPMAEVLRVLVPGGVTYIKGDAAWHKTVKPFPTEIDQWSHWLHDAGNNAVAADTVVGPPRRLQWAAPPLWLRSHETASGIQAQVASGGRLFYLFDEGPIGITDERLPGKWALICRDAFNGKELWRRPLGPWGWRQWARARYEGKDWTQLRAMRVSAPIETHRRVVAAGDRVYATLAYKAPLSVLDAASGKVLTTVKGTEPTQEILYSDGVVVAHVGMPAGEEDRRRGVGGSGASTLVAADGATGEVLWRKELPVAVRPLMTAIDGGKVFCIVGSELLALSLRTGAAQWKVPAKTPKGRVFVAAAGVVLILGGGSLESYDAATGEMLWHEKVKSGQDLFVIDGVAWPGMYSVNGDGAEAVGYDVRTGKEVKRVKVANLRSPEHHHRCYRNKATSRYIISGMEGAEYLDLAGDNHGQNNWVRGACKEGITPLYGMLCVPADQCFCQPGGKLLGTTALLPAADKPLKPVADADRLSKGDAYGKVGQAGQADAGDWPTFRHDPQRHGSVNTDVPTEVRQAWRSRLGGRLTAPVVANGLLLVASIDAHTLYALDAKSGAAKWRYIAGGRVDSPPTVCDGMVLFGSRDGYVYCLRETDGALVWRFLAAPVDRRVGCFSQLESAWPVHGSVLVRDGIAYVTAGRSTYLDGGIRLWGLDPASGAIRHKGLLAGPHRTIDGPRDVAFFVPGANSDVLVAEGDSIYMRQKKVTPDLTEVKPEVLSSKGEADVGMHVFATSSLLDGSGYNRAFWMYSKRWPGFQLANQAPKAGQLVVVDPTTTYSFKEFYVRNVHSPMFFPGKQGYLLFADKNTTEPQIVGDKGARPPLRWLPMSDYSYARGDRMVKLQSSAFGRDKGVGYTRADPPLWTLWLPVRIRAMVKTADTVFVAGPADVYDEKDPLGALEGAHGAVLVAVSAEAGKEMAKVSLDASPVFDGLIAAAGRLYVSLADGSVACLAGR